MSLTVPTLTGEAHSPWRLFAIWREACLTQQGLIIDGDAQACVELPPVLPPAVHRSIT